jgi:hypothetical protein
LREADVGERLLAGCLEDVGDAVGDVVEGELVDGEVPELQRGGRVMYRLLGVFVSTVVAQLVVLACDCGFPAKVGAVLTQTSKPLSTSRKGSALWASVRDTQTSLFIRRP